VTINGHAPSAQVETDPSSRGSTLRLTAGNYYNCSCVVLPMPCCKPPWISIVVDLEFKFSFKWQTDLGFRVRFGVHSGWPLAVNFEVALAGVKLQVELQVYIGSAAQAVLPAVTAVTAEPLAVTVPLQWPGLQNRVSASRLKGGTSAVLSHRACFRGRWRAQSPQTDPSQSTNHRRLSAPSPDSGAKTSTRA
jgi:hypothetical protein